MVRGSDDIRQAALLRTQAPLSLDAAAKFIGIPPDRLHAMSWAKSGPPSNGSYWFPTFDAEALSEWKREHATGSAIPPGKTIGSKAVYRHRQR